MKLAASKAKTGTLLAIVLLAAIAMPAAAEEDGCTGFSFPVDTDIAWMKAADSETVEAGAKLAGLPAKAVTMKLTLTRDLALPVKSGRKKQAIGGGTYSGWFEIASLPKSGVYQISLSHDGWIDAAQNGELVQSQTFSGRPACKAVRKSVRYELAAGPVIVQVAGSPVETVRATIREAN
jgi:hypothetical protein